jgi:hypothetical protein
MNTTSKTSDDKKIIDSLINEIQSFVIGASVVILVWLFFLSLFLPIALPWVYRYINQLDANIYTRADKRSYKLYMSAIICGYTFICWIIFLFCITGGFGN